jgi:hypothetical protein
MTKNPYINALAALVYIVGIVTLIFYGGPMIGGQETIFIPMAMLSLFVLSAALMAYIFLYTPALLAVEGKYKEATTLFLTTVAAFAVATAVLFAAQAIAAYYLPAPIIQQTTD